MLADILWGIFGKLGGFIKYSLVGMIGVGIHFGILWYLTEQVGLWYILSAIIAITLASMNNFALNYLWTFKNRKSRIKNLWIGWLKFLLSIGATEILYLGILYLFTEKVGVHYMWSAFFALASTTVIRFKIASNWIWGKRVA
ncbi:hypothetical protein LCGC14_0341230 [marine sediment metagenome]|uniref:GtrA/DPMS transmembrane domain-containing protein n=1 Tax=marine sediment metagenome TaxID=412755 RepID=A0A0F9W110_9ZZZZ